MVANAFDSNSVQNKRGCYQHWGWHSDSEGARAAHTVPGADRSIADLVSTAYHNKNASNAVYALVLDVDAERTQPSFVDQEGRVDPKLVMDALHEKLPLTHHHLTIVCRSTSGKGLHLFFSMVPVVLTETSDSSAEVFALRVQRSLVAAANEIGIGADPSAIGLQRLVANFNNPDKVVFRDQKKRTKIENAAKDVLRAKETEGSDDVQPHHALRIMGKELEAFLRKARRDKRLYPKDKNVELGYSRFLAFLIGSLVEEARTQLGQLGLLQGYFKSSGFASVKLTMAEMQLIFGETSEPTIRKLLNSRPEIIVTHKKGESIWQIEANASYWHLFDQASEIAKTGASEIGRTWNSPWDLPEPELVENGMRNQYLVWLMNAYKSRGFSEDEACSKIKLRMNYWPNAIRSRTLKRIERKVGNFYRNLPQLQGRYADQPLPQWIEDDSVFLKNRVRSGPIKQEQLGGKKFPCSEPLSPRLCGAAADSRGVTGINLETVYGDLSPGLRGREIFVDQTLLNLDKSPPDTTSSNLLITKIMEVAATECVVTKLLAVVRWGLRVGVFDGDRLVLATTNSRHFVAIRAIETIAARTDFAGIDIKFWYPKRSNKRMSDWISNLESLETVVSASSICGRKATREESMSQWFEKKGIECKYGNSFLAGDPTGGCEDVPF